MFVGVFDRVLILDRVSLVAATAYKCCCRSGNGRAARAGTAASQPLTLHRAERPKAAPCFEDGWRFRREFIHLIGAPHQRGADFYGRVLGCDSAVVDGRGVLAASVTSNFEV